MQIDMLVADGKEGLHFFNQYRFQFTTTTNPMLSHYTIRITDIIVKHIINKYINLCQILYLIF
jgi:hypothetical protein